MPKKEAELLNKNLQDKIESTAVIINNKVDFVMAELRHSLADIKEEILEIKKDGKEIKTQAIKTNGRVTRSEADILEIKKGWTEGFNMISGLNGKFNKTLTDKEIRTEELIKELQAKIERQEKEKEANNKRIIKYMILAILFIASFVGLINAEFVNQII